jgi:hypothetical protein
VHLLETNVVNLTDPSTGVAQYPAFAPAIGWRGSIGMSSYNGLSVALRRPFSNGLLVTANYAYTHEIDNGSNGSGDGDEISPQNPLCLACDRSGGAWDARHVVNGNAVYQLPFGLNKPMLNNRGIASAIAGNWEVTTTALARTGFPVNVLLPSSYTAPDGASGTERPDLVPGVSGRSTSELARQFLWESAHGCSSVRSSSTYSITRSWVSRRLHVTYHLQLLRVVRRGSAA